MEKYPQEPNMALTIGEGVQDPQKHGEGVRVLSPVNGATKTGG
jgi:hypothetical protein